MTPYIVTTHRPGHERPIEDGDRYSRRAVATLDEARRAATASAPDTMTSPLAGMLAREFDLLPESGGALRPLPDGTVIEVEQIDRARLLTVVPGLDMRASDRELVDAYNAQRARP